MPEQHEVLAGAVLGGRYHLGALLGAGGMGAVYDAEQLGLGRRVAVKVLHRLLSEDHIELRRFQREAKAAASLSHPHVVEIIDFDERGPFAYLVMERIVGRSLAQILEAEAPLGEVRVLGLTLQVLSALGAAHAAGIVHRDLKPRNVMVATLPDVGEWVKLVDFGIARMTEGTGYTRLTQSGFAVGTPSMMAPEQALGERVDHRTDIYGVGALVHRLLSGRKLFPGESVADILEAIVSTPAPRLRLARPDVSHALDAAIARALEKDAGARPQSASDMAAELRACLDARAHRAPEPPAHGAARASPGDQELERLSFGPTMVPTTVDLQPAGHHGAAVETTTQASPVPEVPRGLSLPPTSPQAAAAAVPAPVMHPGLVEPFAPRSVSSVPSPSVPPPAVPTEIAAVMPSPRRSRGTRWLFVALGVVALLVLLSAGALAVGLWATSGERAAGTGTKIVSPPLAGSASPTTGEAPTASALPPGAVPLPTVTAGAPAGDVVAPGAADPPPIVPAAGPGTPDAAPSALPEIDAGEAGGPTKGSSRSSRHRRRHRAPNVADPWVSTSPAAPPAMQPPAGSEGPDPTVECRQGCSRDLTMCRMHGGDAQGCMATMSECQRSCSYLRR